MFINELFQDAFFSSIAAIGFASASNPPRRSFIYCGIIAAAGHSCRYVILQSSGTGNHNLIIATAIAALLIGILAVIAAPLAKVPAETYLYPSLLPMIPGIYAYRMFGALAKLLSISGEASFNHYYFIFASQGLTFFAILTVMAISSTAPIFIFKRISFQATRHALQ